MLKQLLCLLLCVGALPAQDETGGRDSQTGPAIHFVRWQRATESGEIYRAAWQALEPHFVGKLSRRRLVDFDGDARKARDYFEKNRDAALIVAFGGEAADAARAALPEIPVVEVSLSERSHVKMRVARDRVAAILRRFAPNAARVGVLAGRETLPGFDLKVCKTRAEAETCDVVWLPEGGDPSPVTGPAVKTTGGDQPAVTGPLLVVTTSDHPPAGVALTVRPDPASAGLNVAALVVGRLRDGTPLAPVALARLQVTVDLDAARRVGYEVPLKMLARADAVRRTP